MRATFEPEPLARASATSSPFHVEVVPTNGDDSETVAPLSAW